MASRRTFLGGAAGIGAAVTLAGLSSCAGLTSSTVQQDAQLIATGLSGILVDLQAVPNLVIPADVVAKIQNELTIINNNAAGIGSLVGSPAAQAISTAVGILATAVAPFFPMAPMVAVAIQAAVVLAQGLINSIPTKSAVAGRMDAPRARAVLVAAATK